MCLTAVQREEKKKIVSNKRETIQAKKIPGQNAVHQNAFVVNDTNTRRFNLRTQRSVAKPRPEKLTFLKKNTHLQSTMLHIRNSTPPKAAMGTESIHISPICGNLCLGYIATVVVRFICLPFSQRFFRHHRRL